MYDNNPIRPLAQDRRNGPVLDLQEGGLRPPPGLSFGRRLWWWFDFIILVNLARLRFIVVLVAIGGAIAYWDTLQAYYEKWARPIFGAETTVSSDIEYWCPMHPTIVREKPDKCPICAMPLSKRKKGDPSAEEALPPGVISRVQLTPYRVALAGIQTEAIGYRPLSKEIQAIGFVEFDESKLARITARVTGKSRINDLHVSVTGQYVKENEPLAELYSPDLVVTVQNLLDAHRSNNKDLYRIARDRLVLWGIEPDQIDEIVKTGKPITQSTIRSPIQGHVLRKYQVKGDYVEEGTPLYDVADLSTVWVEAQVYEDELAFLRTGLKVRATTKAFPNQPFDGEVAFLHPHVDVATRTLRVRFNIQNRGHVLRPGMYATVWLQVPVTQLSLFQSQGLDQWRDHTVADLIAQAVFGPNSPTGGLGALLVAAGQQVVSRQGLVPAVPERAVIDTGSRKIVYREAELGVFEGVLVELGPRSAGYYPLVRGLPVGDRVATAGSFLVDAETRLTGGVGSTYFGASGGPQADRRASIMARPSMTEDEASKVRAALAKLSPVDRKLAEAQQFCPVHPDNRLGSMGVPVKILIQGQPVFLCCKGCVSQAKSNEKATLDKVAEFKVNPKPPPASPPPEPQPEATDPKEAKIKAALSKLSPEDRRLAEEQRFCAVLPENRLGSMGPPIKMLIHGRPVFLCCDRCEEDAKAHRDQTLATAEKLKAHVKAGASPR